jgi:hypothetical protein
MLSTIFDSSKEMPGCFFFDVKRDYERKKSGIDL